MKAFSASITLATEEGTEVSDITNPVRDAVQQLPVATGIALVNTLHTTCALFVNEFQAALVDDLKRRELPAQLAEDAAVPAVAKEK